MIQGLFFRRISRRLAEVEVQGHIFEAYISNGIDMDFLESGIVCFLREAANSGTVHDGTTSEKRKHFHLP